MSKSMKLKEQYDEPLLMIEEEFDYGHVETLEARIVDLTKERDEYNARRQEAMEVTEQWRTKAQVYREALRKIDTILGALQTPGDTQNDIQLLIDEAFKKAGD